MSDTIHRSELAEQASESRNHIRLTALIPALLTAVDEKRLGLSVGVTLSYLRPENQRFVAKYCLANKTLSITPTLARQMRYLDADGAQFTEELWQIFFSDLT